MKRTKLGITHVEILETVDPTLVVDTRTPCGVTDGDALHMCVDNGGNVCLLIEMDGELLPHEIALSGETFTVLADIILSNLENVQ